MSKLYGYPQSMVSKCTQTSRRHRAVDLYLTTWRVRLLERKSMLPHEENTPASHLLRRLPVLGVSRWVVSWLGD